MHQFITVGIGIVLPLLLIGAPRGYNLRGQLHINATGTVKKVRPHLHHGW